MYKFKLKATSIHKYHGKIKKETVTMEADGMGEFINCLYRSSNFLRATFYSELADMINPISCKENVSFKKSFEYTSNATKDIENNYKATLVIEKMK